MTSIWSLMTAPFTIFCFVLIILAMGLTAWLERGDK